MQTITDEISAILADRPTPRPRRKRYPSDDETPAIATRLPHADYERLKALAGSRPLALVVRVILQDWLRKHHADGDAEIARLVTRPIITRNNS